MKNTIDTETKELIYELIQRPKVKRHLNKLKRHHEGSYFHCVRVGMYAVQLGEINDLSGRDLELLGLSGMLHDLGKCDIGLEILDKDGDLNKKQREKINHHPHLAFIKLAGPEFEQVRKIVVAHHEVKTNPYPRSGHDRRDHVRSFKERRHDDPRLKNLTEIIAAADIYDALKEKRSYKKPYSLAKITDIMLNHYTGDRKYIKQVLKLEIPKNYL